MSARLVQYPTYFLTLFHWQTDGSPYRVEKDGAIWRLMFNPSSKSVQDDATEEVVASIQGILCRNGLPPFLDQIG